MNREELIERICPSEYAAARECHGYCSLCIKTLNELLDEYDETIKEAIRDDIWDAMQRGRVDAINAIKYNLQERIIEEINSPYQDKSLCQGLLYGIQRCDWYLSDDKEQGNE